MKILYKDLINCIEEKPSIKQISDKLFQLGHEHEIEGETFNMELTPNRGDCFSLNGLLRDLTPFFTINKPFKYYKNDIPKFNLDFQNDVVEMCPRISFLKIEIVPNIKKYKPYLESYFKNLKQNKKNLFTDISNYLLYETGQPTHCYDFKKLKGNLTLLKTNDEIEFNTLLDKKINLNGTNYVFMQNNQVINLAGIVGGESTSCSKDTFEVLVECAFFKPENIIGNTVKYNIISDAAHRFERGVDPSIHEKVTRRFIKLVEEHAQIKKIEVAIFEYQEIDKILINYNYKKINKIIGFDLSELEINRILSKLGFEFEKNCLIVPQHRFDILNHNDLAEEVARVIGYDNIESKKIKIDLKKSDTTKRKNEEILKDYLIDKGFYEVINFPFTGQENNNTFKLDNPLYSEKSFMRSSLKESLLNNLLHNERRQKDSIKLFEVSNIYKSIDLNNNSRHIGIIACGRLGKNHEDFSKKIDKNFLNYLLISFSDSLCFKIENINRSKIDTKIKTPIFYVEISIKDLSNCFIDYKKIKPQSNKLTIYKPLSEYPETNRDLSFLIKDAKSIGALELLIENFNSNIIKEKFMFDFYINEKNDEIKMGYRFVFQSKDKTLTDSEIDILMKEIIQQSLSIEHVTIPGLKNEFI